MAPLSELLSGLAEHARQLDDTHSLEEFQQQAQAACNGCDLSLEQLASARAALKATTVQAWEALADEGVVLTDVIKWVPVACTQTVRASLLSCSHAAAEQSGAAVWCGVCARGAQHARAGDAPDAPMSEHGPSHQYRRTLNALMRFGKGLQPATAAVLYSWLLRAPGSPVSEARTGCAGCSACCAPMQQPRSCAAPIERRREARIFCFSQGLAVALAY